MFTASQLSPHNDSLRRAFTVHQLGCRSFTGMRENLVMKRYYGFTLIELMVTLTVLAVLATIAIPSLQDFLVRSQRQQVTSELVSAMSLARAEAVKRATPVTLAAKDTGNQAMQGGWRIFVDPLRTGVFDAGAGSVTTLIADQDAFPAGEVKIGRVNSPQLAGSAEYLQFDSLGRVSTITGANGSYAMTVTIQRGGADKAKSALCIGWAGRVRTVADLANNDTGACG